MPFRFHDGRGERGAAAVLGEVRLEAVDEVGENIGAMLHAADRRRRQGRPDSAWRKV